MRWAYSEWVKGIYWGNYWGTGGHLPLLWFSVCPLVQNQLVGWGSSLYISLELIWYWLGIWWSTRWEPQVEVWIIELGQYHGSWLQGGSSCFKGNFFKGTTWKVSDPFPYLVSLGMEFEDLVMLFDKFRLSPHSFPGPTLLPAHLCLGWTGKWRLGSHFVPWCPGYRPWSP